MKLSEPQGILDGESTQEQRWSIIEKLYDLFYEVDDFENVLRQGLERVLTAMGREGGAVFLSDTCLATAFQWVDKDPPEAWKAHNGNPNIPLYYLIEEVLRTGEDLLAQPEMKVARIFPMKFKQNQLGTLLVAGDAMDDEELAGWQPYLQALARAIAVRLAFIKASTREKEVKSLQVISSAQQNPQDIQKSQIEMVKGIQRIFEAEEAILVLFDETNRDLVIKRRTASGDLWVEQTSQKLEPGLIYESVRLLECIYWTDPVATEVFTPPFDSNPEIETRSYICSPLISNGQILGAVALINPPQEMLQRDRVSLYQILANSLANAIFSSRLFFQLKVSNADLEASRWELLNSRNTLRTLFDNLPSSIYIVDSSYTILAINKSRSDRVQQSPRMLVGRKCYEKLYDRTVPCLGCKVGNTLRDNRAITRISREWLDTEKYLDWEVNTYPVSTANSGPIQCILVENDVTEKRIHEADFIQSEKMIAIGQLAAGVAHEINNPLAAIIANAQIMKRMKKKWDEESLDSLNIIESAGVRASQVVASLLSIARKEKDEFGMIDLNKSILHALSLLNHEVVRRMVKIQTDLQPDMPEIIANWDQLQGVWVNLIVNAMDAVEPQAGVVTVTSQYVRNEFKVTVSDNGRGIPEEMIKRIFEPFFTTKTTGHGTGLGLSLCLRMVKHHNGSIFVESLPNKGTKFTVILPDNPNLHRDEP